MDLFIYVRVFLRRWRRRAGHSESDSARGRVYHKGGVGRGMRDLEKGKEK